MNKNIKINQEKGTLSIEINPKIYGLDVIFSASYIFLDKAYILIDGDPEKKIFVQMVPKEKSENLSKLGAEFNNELLNYAFYRNMRDKNSEIRKIILQRALITNDPSIISLDDSEIE